MEAADEIEALEAQFETDTKQLKKAAVAAKKEHAAAIKVSHSPAKPILTSIC